VNFPGRQNRNISCVEFTGHFSKNRVPPRPSVQFTTGTLNTNVTEWRMCNALRTAAADAAVRYGPAFAVTLMCLSACSFWMIFFTLLISGFQVRPYLAPHKDRINPQFYAMLETGGPFAVAFVLNKLLAPLKLMLTLLVLPHTAPRINTFIADTARPWCQRVCPASVRAWCPCCNISPDANLLDTSPTAASVDSGVSVMPVMRERDADSSGTVIEMHPLLTSHETERNSKGE
jgi:hypothetical protein